jgi:hypothetical protein
MQDNIKVSLIQVQNMYKMKMSRKDSIAILEKQNFQYASEANFENKVAPHTEQDVLLGIPKSFPIASLEFSNQNMKNLDGAGDDEYEDEDKGNPITPAFDDEDGDDQPKTPKSDEDGGPDASLSLSLSLSDNQPEDGGPEGDHVDGDARTKTPEDGGPDASDDS